MNSYIDQLWSSLTFHFEKIKINYNEPTPKLKNTISAISKLLLRQEADSIPAITRYFKDLSALDSNLQLKSIVERITLIDFFETLNRDKLFPKKKFKPLISRINQSTALNSDIGSLMLHEGHTILDLAVHSKLKDYCIKLINLDCPVSEKIKTRKFLYNIAKNLVAHSEELDSEQIHFLEKLAKNGCIHPGTPVFFSLIKKFPHFEELAYSRCEISSEEKDKLVGIKFIFDQLESTDDLSSKLLLREELKNSFDDLIQRGFSKYSKVLLSYATTFKQIEQRYRLAKKWMESNTPPEKENIVFYRRDQDTSLETDSFKLLQNDTAYQDIVSMCLSEPTYSYIPLVYSQKFYTQDEEVGIYKPLFHFLLDKFYDIPANRYLGGNTYDHALALAEGLQALVLEEIENVTTEEKQLIEARIPLLIQSLGLCAHWDHQKDRSLSARQIVESIKNPELQFPLLIPCGTTTHDTCIAVFPSQTTQKCRVVLYNSGRGVTYHSSTEENRYQTSLTVEDVPIDSLIREDLWKRILMTKSGPNISSVYDLFFNEIGERGKILAPSNNLLDYEQKQFQGTCSAQCLMTFLRHQLPRGGLYKLLRARLLRHIGKENIQQAPEDMQFFLEKKLSKIDSDLNLLTTAKDEEKYKSTLFCLKNLLEEWGEVDFLKEIAALPSTTSPDRYFLLRICHVKIADCCIKSPGKFNELVTKKSEIFDLALKMYEHKESLRRDFFSALERSQNAEKTARIVFTGYHNFPYKETLLLWLAHNHSPELVKEVVKIFSSPLFFRSYQKFKKNLLLLEFDELVAKLEKEERVNSCLFRS